MFPSRGANREVSECSRGAIYLLVTRVSGRRIQVELGQLAPRLGFAYNVGGKGKTTIRGGWGIFYQPPFVEAFNNMVDSAPWSPQVSDIGTPFMNPYQERPIRFPGSSLRLFRLERGLPDPAVAGGFISAQLAASKS